MAKAGPSTSASLAAGGYDGHRSTIYIMKQKNGHGAGSPVTVTFTDS